MAETISGELHRIAELLEGLLEFQRDQNHPRSLVAGEPISGARPIGESDRWLLVAALTTAAETWKRDADLMGLQGVLGMKKRFERQMEDAKRLATLIESVDVLAGFNTP
jgi:hypothetical protein